MPEAPEGHSSYEGMHHLSLCDDWLCTTNCYTGPVKYKVVHFTSSTLHIS